MEILWVRKNNWKDFKMPMCLQIGRLADYGSVIQNGTQRVYNQNEVDMLIYMFKPSTI